MSATKRAYDFFLETGRDAFKGELTNAELASIGITPMEVQHQQAVKSRADRPSEARFRAMVERYPEDDEPSPYDGAYSEHEAGD